MNSSPAAAFPYSFQLPAKEDIELTAKDCDAWVGRLLDGLGRHGDMWVFAYGSLIWNPDIPVAERLMARVHGYHRSFCIYSFHYRGSREKPGLVLGLDRGGSCRGVAYRVARDDAERVANYLWRREMVSHAYEPKALVAQAGSRRIRAHTFVADHAHEQYAGGLDLARTAALIRHAVGNRGSNSDYLAATVGRLDELGIVDRRLRKLLAMME